jgi:hypothetical protein
VETAWRFAATTLAAKPQLRRPGRECRRQLSLNRRFVAGRCPRAPALPPKMGDQDGSSRGAQPRRVAEAAGVGRPCRVLRVNGRRLTLTNDAAYELIMQVASGELDSVEEIAAILENRPTPGHEAGSQRRSFRKQLPLAVSLAGDVRVRRSAQRGGGGPS